MHESKAKRYTSAEIFVDILTPVHIGCDEKLTRMDYFIDQDHVGVLDQEKWIDFIEEKGLSEAYARILSKNLTRFSNVEWLRQNNVRLSMEQARCLFSYEYEIPLTHRSDSYNGNASNATVNDINRFVRDIHDRPYLPGSSIKGALRTALLGGMIARKRSGHGTVSTELGRLWQQVKTDPTNRLEEQVMSILFSDIHDANGNRVSAKQLSDPFRGIRVSDSIPFAKDDIILLQKHDLRKKRDRRTAIYNADVAPLPLWRECLKPMTETQFALSLDRTHLQNAGVPEWASVEGMMADIKQFRTIILSAYESPLFQEMNEKRTVIGGLKMRPGSQVLNLGGGGGIVEKTLIYALAPTPKDASAVMAAILEDRFRRIRRDPKQPSHPRTLKVFDRRQLANQKPISDSFYQRVGFCGVYVKETADD